MAGLETLGFAVNHDIRSKKIYNFIAEMDYKNGDYFLF